MIKVSLLFSSSFWKKATRSLLKSLDDPASGSYKYTNLVAPVKYRNLIGDHSYGNVNILEWGEGAKLKIGKFCSFAQDVTIILGGEHRLDWVSTYPFSAKVFHTLWPEAKNISGYKKSKGDITIGNDVWVGYGATILSGVTIGDGAVVGARSVVAKNVEPYSIVVGNPSREIRKRFSVKIISDLLKIQWWNWPNEKISQNLTQLSSDKIETFCEKYVKKN